MKITVETTATVTYTCFLTEEDSEKVINYADENGLELTEAVAELYANSEINLYHNSTESDFSTESIDMVEKER
jgi:effector-binding domain-containing protein